MCLQAISIVSLLKTDRPWKVVTRVTWSILEFCTPLNFSGMAKNTIVKFSPRIGPRSDCLVMTNCPLDGSGRVTWRLHFWQIGVNISKTVQETDILTIEDQWEIVHGLSNGSNGSDLEWPWRSLIGCRPFQMQSVKHLCSILHDFNWQRARTVPLH